MNLNDYLTQVSARAEAAIAAPRTPLMTQPELEFFIAAKRDVPALIKLLRAADEIVEHARGLQAFLNDRMLGLKLSDYDAAVAKLEEKP